MATLVKIGNSQGVRIPKHLLDKMQIKGKQLTLEMHEDGGVLVKPVRRQPRAGWDAAYAKAEKEAKDKGIKDPDWLFEEMMAYETHLNDGDWQW